jgi:GMP synthase (glutamine-hydrolysing)
VTTPSIVVLVTGDPVPEARARRGSFVDLIRQTAPAFGTCRWVAHDVRVLDVIPDLTGAAAVIVTGSAASVTEALPWMERTAESLRALVALDVPLLGICFGHQLLGHALGGRVSLNPHGREIGSMALTRETDDPVIGARGTTVVNMTHLDSVVELPPGARRIAQTRLEPNAAVRFGPSAWGVQYHPEIDAGVLRCYFEARRAALLLEGLDVEAAERAVVDAPEGALVIERFLRVALARQAPGADAGPSRSR